jgi:hypothetical protein
MSDETSTPRPSRIPDFQSIEEEAEWWDTHDFTDYLDELRPVRQTWTWLGGSGDEQIEPLDDHKAGRLFRASLERAEARGLPVGGRWPAEPLILTPNNELAKVIRSTYPVEE